MVQYRRPSRSSWTESAWSSFGRTVMGKAIWENPIAARLWEGFQLGMLIRTAWKRIILICVCGWHKNWLERNKTVFRCGKYWIKKLIWGEPTSFLDHVYFGCTQRQCEISKDIWTTTEPCSNREFQREEQRNYHSLKIFVFLHCLMTWLVMQRSVWNDIVSWRTRLHNNSTKYLLHASMTTTSKEEETQICWRIVKYMLSNCSEMAYIWQELDDLTFYGQ